VSDGEDEDDEKRRELVEGREDNSTGYGDEEKGLRQH